MPNIRHFRELDVLWLETAYKCGYISKELFDELDQIYERVLGMLVKMIEHPDHWTIRPGNKK